MRWLANGLGNYPDDTGPGGSGSNSCGCSQGKIFFGLNSDVVNNYVHDNYGDAGIWFDTDDTGSLVSHNYVASNWGFGIFYEASYNADISDNTLVGNGWASNGPWPVGDNPGNPSQNGCTDANIPCKYGLGLIAGQGLGFPYCRHVSPQFRR